MLQIWLKPARAHLFSGTSLLDVRPVPVHVYYTAPSRMGFGSRAFPHDGTLERDTGRRCQPVGGLPTPGEAAMKILSLNFLTCAAKACKTSSASYPLHPKDAELVQDDSEVDPSMLINVLPRLDWAALRTTSTEVCWHLGHLYYFTTLRSYKIPAFSFSSSHAC